jgi:acyl-[acyl-carrier-protein]-phospholipid O-acyltransferase/long-chain-fatty-acid--[acyl-carrier-protein] ligase
MKQLLKNAGFQSFLWTQFLGAFNDNIYKIIVSMRAVHVAGTNGIDYVALAGAVFVIPFLLFSGYSGQWADRFSKRSVMIAVKGFEVAVMLLGLAAFFSTRIELMLAVLFLMSLHSTIFSPAKYGIVPEMLEDKELSRANALLEMTTFVAIVAGTALGSLLFAAWKHEPWKMGIVTLAVAIVGFVTSFKIPRIAPAGSREAFRWNPLSEVLAGTRQLLKQRAMWLTVVGISYFWFLGALLQLDLLFFGTEVMKLDDVRVGLMVTALAVGIGAGSLLAGRLSGDKVELGLVPLGSAFMGLSSILLYFVKASYPATVTALALMGLAGGLFIVPLNAYLQQRAEKTEKGRMIATNNFWNTVGLLAASGILWLLHTQLHVAPDKIVLWLGLATLASTVYLMMLLPDFLVRFVLWSLTHTVFKIRIVGAENVPQRGAALLVANHVSYFDGFWIGSCIQRFVRFMVEKRFAEHKYVGWFFRFSHAISVGTGLRAASRCIERAREELMAGHAVCIFAEGAITRTGNMLPFKRGLERIVDGINVPIVPVHLDRTGARRVTVSFGSAIPADASAHQVRQAIAELGSAAAESRKSPADLLHTRFITQARRNWGRFFMADSTGRELTYGRALTGGFIVANWVRRQCAILNREQRRDNSAAVRFNQQMIGVLLPASSAGAIANFGVALAGKVPVNLNFTAGREAIDSAIERCGIRVVITSRVFLAKAKIERLGGAVFIEDLITQGRIRALIEARFRPAWTLKRGATPDSLATVIFSSGSTGVPKGVMLSHFNVISNIESVLKVFPLTRRDRITGVLPLFHAFGFTVTVWLPAISGCGVAYHPNPTDAKAIGELVEKYRGTLLLSTPTFCHGYTRRCTREQFRSLRYVLVGAEKLREPVAQAFCEAFGVPLLEGYGATEMSPVVAVNIPDWEAGRDTQRGTKSGSVGHPLPGVAVKIVDRETGEPLGPNEEGLLLVKGPNRMLGYLGDADRTQAALEGEWYKTGDIAAIDDDGFLRITDRVARFSKIGGEMVSHGRVEDAIRDALGGTECVVVGVEDDRKGERLAALYSGSPVAPDELWRRLAATELPRLWLPKRDDLHWVEALPLLGTGKIDLRRAKSLVAQLTMAEC